MFSYGQKSAKICLQKRLLLNFWRFLSFSFFNEFICDVSARAAWKMPVARTHACAYCLKGKRRDPSDPSAHKRQGAEGAEGSHKKTVRQYTRVIQPHCVPAPPLSSLSRIGHALSRMTNPTKRLSGLVTRITHWVIYVSGLVIWITHWVIKNFQKWLSHFVEIYQLKLESLELGNLNFIINYSKCPVKNETLLNSHILYNSGAKIAKFFWLYKFALRFFV